MVFKEKNFIIKKIKVSRSRKRTESYILSYNLFFLRLSIKSKNTKKRVQFENKDEVIQEIKNLESEKIRIGVTKKFKLCIYI